MIIFFILIIILVVTFCLTKSNYVRVCLPSGRCYKVLPGKTMKSAYILDSLYNKYVKLQNYMTRANLPTKETANKLKCRMSQESIMEVPNGDNTEGYTTDKGKIIKIKLRENGEYKDMNYITYVFLHELAHVMCDSYGHNNEFNKNFKFILKLAVEKNLYIPSKDNSVYICGSKNCIYKYT